MEPAMAAPPITRFETPSVKGEFVRIPGDKFEYFEFCGFKNIKNALLRIERIRSSDIDKLPPHTAVFKCDRQLFCSPLSNYVPLFNYSPALIKKSIENHPTPRQMLAHNIIRRVTKLSAFFSKALPAATRSFTGWRDWECPFFLTMKMIYTHSVQWGKDLKADPHKDIYIKKDWDRGIPFTVMSQDTKRVYVNLGEWLCPKVYAKEKYVKGGIEANSGRQIVRLKHNKHYVNTFDGWPVEVEIHSALKKEQLAGEDTEGLCVALDIIHYESKVQIVLERYDEDLVDIINEKKLTPVEQLRYSYQISKGLAFLHKLGYAHHDLKLENVMTRGGNAYIIDFGFGQKISEHSPFHRGSKGYVPPDCTSCALNPVAWDAWTLGMVLDIILNQKPSQLFELNYNEDYAEFNKELDKVQSEPLPPPGSLKWVIRWLTAKNEYSRMTPTVAFHHIADIFKRQDLSEFKVKSSNFQYKNSDAFYNNGECKQQ